MRKVGVGETQCDDGDLAGLPTPGPTPVSGITLGTWRPEAQTRSSLQLALALEELKPRSTIGWVRVAEVGT